MSGTTVIVVAKEPVAGRVKTRLCPPWSPAEAAALATAALKDTLAAVLEAPARRRVLLLDGAPGRWLPAGFEVAPQIGGTLDERLAAALDAAAGPTVLVGMDTPQLPPAALALCGPADAAFGPAADGGFWCLGLREPDGGLVRGVPMSRATTGAAVLRRLRRSGRSVTVLAQLRDVDTAADARAVAAEAPHTRFGRLHDRLLAVRPSSPVDRWAG